MFNDRIRELFQFLVDEYGFTATDPLGNVVEYTSERCCVVVSVDLDGRVEVKFVSTEPQIIRRRHMDLEAALRYLDPSFRFKVKYPPGVSTPDLNEKVGARLAAYARLMRRYGEPFLQGDFSIWEPVEQQRLKEIEPWLRQLRGEEPFRHGS